MSQRPKTLTIVLNAAIFIILEVAALAILNRSSALHNTWFNRSSQRTQGAVFGFAESVRNYFALKTQNDSLAMENARLLAELARYREMEESVGEAESVVTMPDSRFRYIPATVVRMSRNTVHNHIILNKGLADGVVARSGIITERGVVGIVTAVDEHYAYGLTLMNGNLTVSAKVGNSSLTAPLYWDGLSNDGAWLGDIPPHHAVAPGDTVRTSGYSSIFPAGIPIGLTSSTRLLDGATVRVDVDLFQDFSGIHYVTIVENIDKLEIEALENAENVKGK
ncbi:MAG TPA: hypothetical protein DDX33_03320 [Rikenellaceae bacterium]|nr:hypothetical protein [Rikenellaceae bacterium]HBH21030.1 hypothetical protein [Rikenellaceae bacterium]